MRLAILLWRQRARSMCQDREAGLGALGAVDGWCGGSRARGCRLDCVRQERCGLSTRDTSEPPAGDPKALPEVPPRGFCQGMGGRPGAGGMCVCETCVRGHLPSEYREFGLSFI